MKFSGIIIEESLKDKAVLDLVKIASTEVEKVTPKHKTPWLKQWTMHTVEIPADKAPEVAEEISKALDDHHTWYADLQSETEHYIVYPHKVFHITNRTDSAQYQAATDYGASIGIPNYQVDFSPHIKKWERD